MQREHKVWGERWLIREDSTHANSYLFIRKGFQCSWHVHQTKYNLFVVVSGEVGIITEEIDGELIESRLTKGQTLTIKPGQRHLFKAYEDSELIEEMFVQYSEDDINRDKAGGKFNASNVPGIWRW